MKLGAPASRRRDAPAAASVLRTSRFSRRSVAISNFLRILSVHEIATAQARAPGAPVAGAPFRWRLENGPGAAGGRRGGRLVWVASARVSGPLHRAAAWHGHV